VLSFPAASLLDSCFPHAMNMCTIQGSLKVHFFLWFFATKKSFERFLCARMVKLTNLLVEPKTHKFWHSF